MNVKEESNPSFFKVNDTKRIAYHLSDGKLPCVIFMGGFKSDMTGSKAIALETFCRARGQRFIRFDYTGHGASSGTFREGTIGSWQEDVLVVLDNLASEQNILVGSSMGGWQMMLAALAKPQKIVGLIGIASAPDFTETLIWNHISDAQKKELAEKGEFTLPACNGEEPYPITRKLIEDGRRHLLLKGPVAIHVPIRLIHGLKDEDVPWRTSVEIAEKLASKDAKVILVKDGGHRMSEPDQLSLLCKTLAEMLDAVAISGALS